MSRRSGFALAGLCLAVGWFCLAYPIYVIRPFRHQGARELAVALQVMQWRNLLTVICALTALITVAYTWRSLRNLGRITIAAFAVTTIAAALFTRVNIYEQMFHPLGEPAFLSISQSKLAPDEKVVSVALNGQARAYPIRNISYHHIVNDTLGGVPIVATY